MTVTAGHPGFAEGAHDSARPSPSEDARVAESEPSRSDGQHMTRALELAARGLGRVEPNPMVGAVLVRDGSVVGEGWHEAFGGPHAEVHALRRAAAEARGATLYVTLEPCCHQGKTPPCSDAVMAAGVARVVAAMSDPFAGVAGGGLDQLRKAGLGVEVGLMETEARRLNAPFIKWCLAGRPYVTAKWAQTLDGRLAMADRRWISSPESRRWVHTLRSRMDAILIGIGTALADDPLLTVRVEAAQVDYGRRPTRIVLDAGLRLPLESKLVRTAGDAPLVVACDESVDADRARRLEERGVTVLRLPRTGTDAKGLAVGALLDELGRRGMTNLMVEGGAGVLGSFFREKLVDRLAVFVAPRVSGDASQPAAWVNPVAARPEPPTLHLKGDVTPGEVAAGVGRALHVLRPSIGEMGGDSLLEGVLRDW